MGPKMCRPPPSPAYELLGENGTLQPSFLRPKSGSAMKGAQMVQSGPDLSPSQRPLINNSTLVLPPVSPPSKSQEESHTVKEKQGSRPETLIFLCCLRETGEEHTWPGVLQELMLPLALAGAILAFGIH